MKNILKLYKYISDERNRLIYTALLSAGLSLAGGVTPLFFKYVIDQISALANGKAAANVAETVGLAILAMALLQLISTVFDFIQERLSDRLYADLLVKVYSRVFSHLMNLSIDFYEQTKVGETMMRVDNAIFEFTGWIQNVSETWLAQVLQMLVSIALLCYVNLTVGLVVTVLMAAGVAVQVLRISRARALRGLMRKQYEEAGGHLYETIGHIATIRSSVDKSIPTKRYNEALEKARELQYRTNNIEQYGNLARGTINDVALMAAVALVAWQAVRGKATAGDVVAVALYIQQIRSSVGPLGRLIVNTAQTESSVQRITELLETEPTIVDKPDAVELDKLETIEFKKVDFCYPGKKHRVLKNVSFKVNKGQTLALVGPSGTGKTTITKLMLRFYEPSSGKILINSKPIKQFKAESIRRHIGMVMQDVALFNDSVEANLQLAAPNASKEEIGAAAVQAHADVFIDKLPEKYQTMVGERGVKLSGGEKQRVAVARAILKKPDLIILDEATSALDSESERHVQAGLRKLMADRTAVIIAHRLSTVMRADNILVLKNGQVVEHGAHEDLVDFEGGLYARLFKLQTEGLAKL